MGQLGSNLGNSNVTNPNQARPGDLDASEKSARLIAGGTQGLAKGFQGMQQQNAQMRQGGGGGMGSMPQAQPVSPDYFSPQAPTRKPMNSFYGQ